MAENKEHFQEAQSGTGSAEQTGRDRAAQQQNQQPNEGQMQDIANQIGESRDAVSSIRETGGFSGRDDASGGSGDRMENESTNDNTDRS
ncbi:MAG: hypothetical protein EOO14_05495 [Chitinophagaceae bacterium]|nr:MAG: hypothetical protein EOO14_05495 [Chitinophagaceae bacterium]